MEVARISRSTLRRWEKEGRLRALHLGEQTLRYRADELMTLLKGGDHA